MTPDSTERHPAGRDRVVTGWGRISPARVHVVEGLDADRIAGLMARRPSRGVIGRGAGMSYGDAAQNAGGLVLMPGTGPPIQIDPSAGTVTAPASTTFTELLTRLVPYGLLPPVLPGTRHLTLGGAVAADVHGKNQLCDGAISAWIDEIQLIDGTGGRRVITPCGSPAEFRATVGGMGLTGIITAVTLRLTRIRSALLRVARRRALDLDALMSALDTNSGRYGVAWIDTTATGRSFGRGVLEAAEHLDAPDPRHEQDGLVYRIGRVPRAPALPFGPVTPLTARAFNSLWFRRAPTEDIAVQDLPTFFHRLDALAGWNRTLGPHGFLQYQFMVPEDAYTMVAEVLHALRRHRAAPFLGTLKRFGPATGGPLSFPGPGWSLAVDMPDGGTSLRTVLDGLDQRIAEVGGRLYLAKDARLGRTAFNTMYGPLTEWRATRAALDPAGVLRSDLGRRLGLLEEAG
jgi:decaprenylphospho-beta-D-ribofuranose 2-oxidase